MRVAQSNPAPKLDCNDLSAMRRDADVSARAMGRTADGLRDRADAGLTGVSSVSSSVLRKNESYLNKAWLPDYESFAFPISRGGYGYRLKDVKKSFQHFVYTRGKELGDELCCNVIMDEGDESLKEILIVRLKDDPLLQDDVKEDDIIELRHDNTFRSDGSPKRGLVLLEISVGESHYTVHEDCNSVRLEPFIDLCMALGIELTFPGDMAMTNHKLGMSTQLELLSRRSYTLFANHW